MEGLLRASYPDGTMVPPVVLFDPQRPALERAQLGACARGLHLAHFSQMQPAQTWLFLNADLEGFLLADDGPSRFAELLQQHGVAPHQVVLEILEHAIDNIDDLARAIQGFRELGCLIAVDDFGAGHSNLDRLWRLAPDIVKLDRLLVRDAAHQARARAVLPRLVALLHEVGALVLTEGVETEAEGLLALESQCDFVQGFWFARPAADPPDDQLITPRLDLLWQDHASREQRRHDAALHLQNTSIRAFRLTASRLASGQALAQAAIPLLAQPDVLRCFVLDDAGRQLGDNLEPDDVVVHCLQRQQRFSPLANTRDALWSRRTYFRQAMRQPGQVQCTSPYLSMTEPTPCITLSMAIDMGDCYQVLCADLRWHDPDALGEVLR